MKLLVLDSAKNDLIEGYKFYEKQKSGLGAYFLDSLYSDIESLVIYAGIHRIVFGEFHRLLSKRFPFAIYYKIQQEDILIYAILDCRREPSRTKSKIRLVKSKK